MSRPIPQRVRLLCIVVLLSSLSPVLAQNAQLVVNNGTTLTVSGSHFLLYNTDLHNNGVLNAASGTVWVTGANISTFNGSGSTQAGTFVLSKTVPGLLTLNTPMKISGTLNFLSGVVNLNGQKVELTGAGVLQNENEANHITGITGGSITASATGVSNPALLNIGNLGAAITSSANLGNVSVTRTQVPAVNPANPGLQGIQRTYLIQPQNNTALNATLRFYYLNEELNGKVASLLNLWKSEDGIIWSLVGADTRNTTSKYVEKNGISSFSYWTLTDITDPLPLTLLSFRVSCENGYALVQWQTGVESALNEFQVEGSVDAVSWSPIGNVAATNAISGSTYSYKDQVGSANVYYRLKIIEQDGSFSYSPVFRGACSDITLPFTVYPNPAITQAVAQLSVRQPSKSTLELIDMGGRLIYSAAWSLQTGINQYVLPVSSLAGGTYLIRLVLPGSILQTKLIKK